MNAGFVTFTDKVYEPLARVLINGIEKFSKYPIEVFTLNYTMENVPSNAIPKRINESSPGIFWPYTAKIIASIRSEFDFAAIIDADCVPNVNVDELLEMAKEFHDIQYPLCSAHPMDPRNWLEWAKIIGVKKKSMDYVQANFIFSKNSKPFLDELMHTMKTIERLNGPNLFNVDETLLNILLWKHNADKQLYPFIPSGLAFDDYADGCFPCYSGYYGKKAPSFHLFHGEKNPVKSKAMLDYLVKQNPIEFRCDQHRSKKLQFFTEFDKPESLV